MQLQMKIRLPLMFKEVVLDAEDFLEKNLFQKGPQKRQSAM